MRVYSGILNSKCSLKNVSRDQIEKAGLLYRVRADNYINISDISCGDIAAIAGLKYILI